MKLLTKISLVLSILAALVIPPLLGLRVAAVYGPAVGVLAALFLADFILLPHVTRLGGHRLFNSLGTLVGTLVIQRALQLVFTKYPMLAMISMGFRDLDGRVDTMNLGQTATSRLRTIPVVQNFGDAATAVTSTDVTLTLSGFKQVFHSFTAAEVNSTDRNLIDEAAEPMAIAIAGHVINSVCALWTSRVYARSVTEAEAAADYDTLRALRKQLQLAKVAAARRFGVFNAEVYDNFLGDDRIVTAFNNPMNANAIATGNVPNTMGLNIAEYTDLDANNGSAKAITAAATGDLVTSAGHGLVNGDRVTFPTLTGGAGLTAATQIYYVIGAATDTFQVSLTAGGAAVDITTNYTAGTVKLAENLIGFAGGPDSTVYVARAPKNPEELFPGVKFSGLIGYVQEPITGFQVMVNQWIGTDLSLNNRLVWLEGFGPGNTNSGVRLISA